MNCLVTGGCGFIGSNLIELLLNEKHNVVSLDNYSTGTKDNEHTGCVYHNVDILDVDDFSKFGKFDVVFHLAAEVASIKFSYEQPLKTLNSNILGTLKICDFARKENVRVVYSSSCGVTDGSDSNIYAFSKSQAEQICKSYSNFFDISVAIVRFSNVYGDRQRKSGPYASVISIFNDCYDTDKPLAIRGTGKQTRDFIDVRDICVGLLEISKNNWNADIFPLGTGKSHSINQIAEWYNTTTEYVPNIDGEVMTSSTNINDINLSKINFKSRYKIKNYIKQKIKENF